MACACGKACVRAAGQECKTASKPVHLSSIADTPTHARVCAAGPGLHLQRAWDGQGGAAQRLGPRTTRADAGGWVELTTDPAGDTSADDSGSCVRACSWQIIQHCNTSHLNTTSCNKRRRCWLGAAGFDGALRSRQVNTHGELGVVTVVIRGCCGCQPPQTICGTPPRMWPLKIMHRSGMNGPSTQTSVCDNQSCPVKN